MHIKFVIYFYLFGLVVAAKKYGKKNRPHIFFILLDDVGHNDVGWNNEKMHTPFMNKLARDGVILDNYYTYFLCTPSRASLLTGRYSDRLGLQRNVLTVTQPYGIPVRYKLISEPLKKAGYSTHAIGKWHVGYCNWLYTPNFRGFDSFLGFYNGGEENYKHCVNYLRNNSKGECIAFDYRKNADVAHQYDGDYSTYVYTDHITNLIDSWKNKRKPLFAYVAVTDTHFPLQAPRHYLSRCSDDMNDARKEFCGAMAAVDEAVQNITMTLQKNGMYKNSIIIVASDNGGATHFGASNYPLRGEKSTIFEGGVRVPAFVHSPLLQQIGYINKRLIHVSDWFPTILQMAHAPNVYELDGFGQWATIAMNQESPRKYVPIHIDQYANGSLTAGIRDRRYKLIAGSGGYNDQIVTEDETEDQSFNATYLDYYTQPGRPLFNLTDTTPRLYDLEADPTESRDLASEMPEKVQELTEQLDKYRAQTRPFMSDYNDPKGDPANFNNECTPGWCDVYYDTPT